MHYSPYGLRQAHRALHASIDDHFKDNCFESLSDPNLYDFK
jgi:hypothetical protein